MTLSYAIVFPVFIYQLQLRPADRTSVRLGVKAPVQWVIVFPLTLGTHIKLAHRSIGPVIGNILDNRETRPAVCAIRKGIMIAAVVCKYFFPAICTGSNIRRDRLIFTGLVSLPFISNEV